MEYFKRLKLKKIKRIKGKREKRIGEFRRKTFSPIRLLTFSLLLFLTACQNNIFQQANVSSTALRDVSAVRLNFRYEADVPAPSDNTAAGQADEVNPAVRIAFEANRASDAIVRTIVSPNNQRILVAYSREGDLNNTFRLDMFGADGSFIRRVTPDLMAVVFPQSIVWSPDSTAVAFSAIAREGGASLSSLPPTAVSNTNTNSANSASNSNTATNTADIPTTEIPAPIVPQGDAPPNVLTFRTEQIYIATSEGTDVKPVTQNEGLIYYYFAWSPDSLMLVCLASAFQEWRYLQFQAAQKGEHFVPLGRPRIVEKNGRERRLDDNLTKVHPVWSPDSAKIAVGFDQQIRIYDAIGDVPTQAAIPLRNQLLISSQEYDRLKSSEEQAANVNANIEAISPVNTNQPITTLPDPATLVSFQPIINLEWSAENILYLQTGYVREYVNASENRYSSLRWHRLILSPQTVSISNKQN